MHSKKAAEIARILEVLFEEHSAPCYLHTDNGTEFINELVTVLCELESSNIKVKHGRPYHPQSQGQVENLNRRVKICLSNFLLKFDEDRRADVWPSLLKPVAYYINHTWHHTIKNTPYSVFFGRMMDHLSCEVQKIQCKGFLEEDFLVQITDDTEDDSNTLDLSEWWTIINAMIPKWLYLIQHLLKDVENIMNR